MEADLTTPDAFGPLVPGGDVVLHMASPYVLDTRDPQRELVQPAVQGTRWNRKSSLTRNPYYLSKPHRPGAPRLRGIAGERDAVRPLGPMNGS